MKVVVGVQDTAFRSDEVNVVLLYFCVQSRRTQQTDRQLNGRRAVAFLRVDRVDRFENNNNTLRTKVIYRTNRRHNIPTVGHVFNWRFYRIITSRYHCEIGHRCRKINSNSNGNKQYGPAWFSENDRFRRPMCLVDKTTNNNNNKQSLSRRIQ